MAFRSGSWRVWHTRRIATIGIAGLAFMALAAGLATMGAPVAEANETPVQQAVTLDSPAVVRIVSVITARLTCVGCATDGSNVVSPAASSDPFTYYSSGSGAFITSTGAVLTADHVVDHSMSNPEDVNFVEQQAAQDIAQRYSLTTDQVLSVFQAKTVTIAFTTESQRAYLSTAYTGEITDPNRLFWFNITMSLASSPVSEQDTAIVQIDTSQIKPGPDFPYLTLSSGNVQALDNVTAIAYPSDADLALNSNADFTALLDTTHADAATLSSLLTASANPGQVTKVDTQGYETTGIASQGSSGGPVINDQGQVIGFVDRGLSNVTVIIPSNVVATYTAKGGVSNPPAGRFMTAWSKAVSDYYATGTCHYTNAASDFSALSRQYPQFAGDEQKRLADDARLKAAGETCATGGASTGGANSDVTAGFLLIGGCLLAGLLVIVVLIFLIVSVVRRKPTPAPVRAPAPNYPPAQPGHSPVEYRPQGGPVYPAPPAQAPVMPNPAAPAGQMVQPNLSAPLGPTRFCPRGHAVLEADATFCPICGAPLTPAPDR